MASGDFLPPPPSSSPRRTGVWIGVAIVGACSILFLALIAAGIGAIGLLRQREAPRETRQPAAEVYREASRAFRGRAIRGDKEELPEIQKTLNELGQAYFDRNAAAISANWDFARYIEQAYRFGAPFSADATQRRREVARLGPKLELALARQADVNAWRRSEIRQLDVDPKTGEAVAYARLWLEIGVVEKVRIWFIAGEDGWRVFDFEYLLTGYRMSHATAVLTQQIDPSRLAQFREASQKLRDAGMASAQFDLQALEENLEAIEGTALPPVLDAQRWLFKGKLLVATDRDEEGIVAFDHAGQLNPDMPVLHFLRAEALIALQKYDQGLAECRRYEDLLGADADTHWQTGLAMIGLERVDDALKAFRRGLDDSSDHGSLLYCYAVHLPPERRSELNEFLSKYPMTPEKFEEVASVLQQNREIDALEAIVEAHRPVEPHSTALIFYDASVKFLREDYQAAVDVMLEAFHRVERPDMQEAYLGDIGTAARLSGRTVEAYKRLIDEPTLFSRLAEELYLYDDLEQLRALIDAHAAHSPGDARLDLYRGHLFLSASEYENAEVAYAAGAAKASDDELREEFRRVRVGLRYDIGTGLAAYHELGPREATLDQLIGRCRYPGNPELLAQLIAAHRVVAPSDPRVPEMETIHASLRGDDALLVELLERHRDVLVADERFGAWMHCDSLVRALVRLDRLDDALDRARRHADLERLPLYRALIAARRGDVEGTKEALDLCIEKDWDPFDFYMDDDLGPILRTEPFAEIRKTWPDPFEETPADAVQPDAGD